ncbi:MAG: hypothetical protein RJA41_272 [Actinomycetota bacterium]
MQTHERIGGFVRTLRALMATPRQSSIRGSRLRSTSSGSLAPETPEEVEDPKIPRHVVDHALARREAILEIRRTAGFDFDGADTDPYLLRAAKYYGQTTERMCPICTKTALSELTYVYSVELGYASGKIVKPKDLPKMASQYGFLSIYMVEVCQGCGWNHALVSYVLGDGKPRKAARKPRDLN